MTSHVYTLRVAYAATPDDPAIITLGDQHTLADLHDAIQRAFNWDADHLYSFFLSGQPWDAASEYAMHLDTLAPGGQAPAGLASATTCDSLGLQRGQTFLYLFDYGDEHHFDIQVETVSPADQRPETPRIERLPVRPPEQYPADEWDYSPDELDELDELVLKPEEQNRLQRELTSLFEQALGFAWGGDDKLHEPVPEHIEATLIDTDEPYPPPLDELLYLGDLRTVMLDPDPRITNLGLTQAHVPDLVRMVRDRSLNTAMSDTTEVWAPAHALRALELLDITGVIPDLIPIFNLDDDWMPPYLVQMLGQAGAPALEPLEQYAREQTHWVYGRAEATSAIKEIGLQHPELRARSIQILSDLLARANDDDPDFNGFVVGDLVDLNATEALPVIRQAFALQCVDEMVAGDWTEVLRELGMVPDPNDPLLRQQGYKEQLAEPLALPSPPPAPAPRKAAPAKSKPQKTQKTQKTQSKPANEPRKTNRSSKKKKKRK